MRPLATEARAALSALQKRPAQLLRLHEAMMTRLRTRNFLWIASLVVALTVGTSLLHVMVRLQVLRAGYALSREHQAQHELTQQNQRLRLEIATRKNPATVERLARERLRMVLPDPAAIRVVRGDAP